MRANSVQKIAGNCLLNIYFTLVPRNIQTNVTNVPFMAGYIEISRFSHCKSFATKCLSIITLPEPVVHVNNIQGFSSCYTENKLQFHHNEDWLMLNGQVSSVYFKNHTEHINTLCQQK
jgi:hypothetical protein